MNKKSVVLPVAALLAIGVVFTSFRGEEKPVMPKETTRLTATLNGANEKPAATTSPATGTFAGELDPTTRVLSYTVTYEGFPQDDQPTMGHIHRITKDDGTGPPEVFLKSLKSPIMGTTDALPQSKVDSMLNGFYYVNLHTNMFKPGAIRGDVKKQ